jgi:hypothetical protein
MSLKWGPQFRVELTPRLEEWLEEIRLRNPHYTNEEILFAALVCGLDLLRRDERLAWRLEKWYPPPFSTVEHFPLVAIRVLSGKICTHVPKRPPHLHRGISFDEGSGPW